MLELFLSKYKRSMSYTLAEPNGYLQIVHSHDLGEKRGGLYDKGTWSEVLMEGVPLDTILDLELQDKFIDYMNNHSEESEQVIINDRNVDSSVKLSESQNQYLMGNTCGKYLRKRKIPKKTHKKYPTKPSKKEISKINKEVSFSEDVQFHESVFSRM
jgi:hypothetical protein